MLELGMCNTDKLLKLYESEEIEREVIIAAAEESKITMVFRAGE
ncbi:MAG: hypothetical protein ACI94Y_000311 [Maribacter sp.]|jgi:hypothetical protein